VLNALAFSTLLSSQGADAHLRRTLIRLQGNYSNLPEEILVVNQAPKNLWNQLGLPPTQATLPDKLPWSRKAHRFVLPGGSRRSWSGAWPFRSPAGKKNSRDGRGRRQIKRRGSRTLTRGPSRAVAQKPRSQAVRTTPLSPQIRSGPAAGTPGQADLCCRLIGGVPRPQLAKTSDFRSRSRRSEPFSRS
jgi:hypothetical protein